MFQDRLLAGVLALLMMKTAMPDDTLIPLFDFTEADAAKQWQTDNDGVMGGVSEGKFKITDAKTMEFFECDKTGGIRSIAGSKYFVWRRQRRQKQSFVSCWTRSPYRRMGIARPANGPPAGSHSCRLVEQLRQRRALDPPCLSPTWTIVRKMWDRYSVNVPDSIRATYFCPKCQRRDS